MILNPYAIKDIEKERERPKLCLSPAKLNSETKYRRLPGKR
jgi:hypothetical protein